MGYENSSLLGQIESSESIVRFLVGKQRRDAHILLVRAASSVEDVAECRRGRHNFNILTLMIHRERDEKSVDMSEEKKIRIRRGKVD